MTDPIPDPPELDPAALAGTNFSRVRKGFEPAEVRSALGRTADALRAWQERDDRLTERLSELEQRLSASEELDEQRITTVLGEETARIVTVAREAAAEIRAKAEEHSARLVRESEESAAAAAAALMAEATSSRDEATRLRSDADAEATRVRDDALAESTRLLAEAEATAALLRDDAVAEAERVREEARAESTRLRDDAQASHDEMLERAGSVLEERTAEADAVAAGIREAADVELTTARAEGERIREEARDAAMEEIDRARSEGREMVAEARRLRERMLRDLAERRRTARRQIEAARAGRDRIVEALQAAGVVVSEAVEGLGDSDDDARRSADAAAAAVDDDIDSVVAEFETGLGVGGFPTIVPEADTAGDATGPGHGDAPVTSIGGGDVAVDDRPGDEGGAADGQDAEDQGEEDRDAADQDADGGERSPGATVHDLFERIRAERSGDEQAGDADVGEGSEVVEAEGSIDLTEVGGPDGGAVSVRAEGSAVAVSMAQAAPADSAPVAAGQLDEAAPEDEVAPDAVPGGTVADEAPEEAVGVLDRRDDLLAPAEKSLARTLKRLVSDEQNEVLDRLRRIKRGRPEITALLGGGEDVERFADALGSDFRVAAEAGLTFWGERSGDPGSGTLSDPEALRAPLVARVTELLEIRRAHIQKVLDDADAEGLEPAEIGDHIRAAYREWRSHSVGEQAGDLATAGFAQGLRDAAGAGTPWCWVPDNGGLPCSDAEDNSLAGPVPCGDAFPTGDAFPPAHSGCRCILVPGPR